MTPQKGIVFFEGETVSPGKPIEYYRNLKADIMSVEISGNFTSGTFHFEGVTDYTNEEWTPIAGVNLSDYSIASDPSGKGIWEVPLEGLQKFRVRVESVSGGSAKVFGWVVVTSGV